MCLCVNKNLFKSHEVETQQKEKPQHKVESELVYAAKTCPYGTILAVYLKRRDEQYDVYAPFINEDENVYMDDSKGKLFLKHAALSIYRPLHGIIKLISIPLDIALDAKRGEFKKRIFSRIQDIVRIPFLTLIMEIYHLSGLILSIFDSNILYWTREIAGKLELKMYRVDKFFLGKVKDVIQPAFPCFTPILNLRHLDYMIDKEEDIIGCFKNQLSWLRKNWTVFHGFRKLEEDPYISPTVKHLKPKEIVEKWKFTCWKKEKLGLNGIKNFEKKENLEKIKEMQKMYEKGVHYRDIAQKYKISSYTFWDIQEKHFPDEQ